MSQTVSEEANDEINHPQYKKLIQDPSKKNNKFIKI